MSSQGRSNQAVMLKAWQSENMLVRIESVDNSDRSD